MQSFQDGQCRACLQKSRRKPNKINSEERMIDRKNYKWHNLLISHPMSPAINLMIMEIDMKRLVTKHDIRQGEKIELPPPPVKRSPIDRHIQFRFHLFAKCDVPMVYITLIFANKWKCDCICLSIIDLFAGGDSFFT